MEELRCTIVQDFRGRDAQGVSWLCFCVDRCSLPPRVGRLIELESATSYALAAGVPGLVFVAGVPGVAISMFLSGVACARQVAACCAALMALEVGERCCRNVSQGPCPAKAWYVLAAVVQYVAGLGLRMDTILCYLELGW